MIRIHRKDDAHPLRYGVLVPITDLTGHEGGLTEQWLRQTRSLAERL